MPVKASVSISDQQEAFARELVAQGRFSSVSAVVQHGLDLLQRKTELEEAETQALRKLLQDRAAGPFESAEDFGNRIDAMIERKRMEHGLDD